MSEYIVDMTLIEDGEILSQHTVMQILKGIVENNDPLVRCKDCKHRTSKENGFVDIFGHWHCNRFNLFIDPMFFCGEGELYEEGR